MKHSYALRLLVCFSSIRSWVCACHSESEFLRDFSITSVLSMGSLENFVYVPSIWRKLGIQMRRHFSSSRIREAMSQQTLDFIELSPRSIQIISIHRKKYKIGEHIAIRMLKSLVAIGAEIFCSLPADPRKYRRYKYERRSVAWMHRPQRGVWGWPWLHDWWLNRRSHWHNCHGVHRAVFAMASHQIICGRGRVVQ